MGGRESKCLNCIGIDVASEQKDATALHHFVQTPRLVEVRKNTILASSPAAAASSAVNWSLCPSVGTWLTPRLIETRKNTSLEYAAATMAAVSQPPLSHADKAVGELEVRKSPETFHWCLSPSIGTWLQPKLQHVNLSNTLSIGREESHRIIYQALDSPTTPTKSSKVEIDMISPISPAKGRNVSAIANRLKAYEVACQGHTRDSATKNLASTSSARQLQKRRMSDVAGPSRPSRKLSNITEQRVLKTGILEIYRLLVASSESELQISEMPKRNNGACLQSSSFLTRLLQGKIEVKSCMEAEAAAAQADVRHLRLQQLLAIRSQTLDFLTNSASHSAHNSFLETVDKHLFEKLTRKLLGDFAIAPEKPHALHALGLRMTLVMGVARMLSEESPSLVPMLWAIDLCALGWRDSYKVAIFNSQELLVEPLIGENPDFMTATAGKAVGIIKDRSSGAGQHRMFHWEVFVVDPQTEDVLAKMARLGSASVQSEVAMELAESLRKRSISSVEP